MKDQYVLTLDPDQMCLHHERRDLESMYKQLRSSSARAVFRQLTQLYFQSLCKPRIRSSMIIGVCQINREQLEYAQMFGERLRICSAGLVVFSRDVTADLVEDCIRSIKVLGWIKADAAIRRAIKSKIR